MKLGGVSSGGVSGDPWPQLGLLLARIGFGGAVLVRHGYPKIPALVSRPGQFFDPLGLGPELTLGLAVFAEFVCAVLVIAGLLGRLPYLPLVVNFAVIVLVVHRFQVPGDRGELALLYLIAFTMLLLTGPGKYSLGAWLSRRRDRAVDRRPEA